MKNKSDYIKAFDHLPKGVDAAEIYAWESHEFEVDVQNGEIESYDISHTGGVSVRVDCGEIGYTLSQATDDTPERLIELAAKNASVVQTEDAKYMRFYAGDKEYPETKPSDPRLEKATAQQKIDMAMELERRILAKNPIIKRVEHSIVGTGAAKIDLFNSLGLSVSRENGRVAAYLMPIGEKNGQVKNGMGFDVALALEDIDMDRIVDEAIEDVMGQFDAKSVEAGTYDVVMKNDAFANLLNVFSGMFSAEAAQKGLSLLAGREGETIASSVFSLVDDPMNTRILSQRPFDAEGVASKKTPIIENGRFITLLHNRKTAAKGGVQTTGNATHSGSGSLGVGASQLLLAEGTDTRENLYKKMQNGLYITDVSGLHAGANAVSGDFSLLCRGFEVKNGEIGQAVEQITMAGNFLAMLKQIVAVGKDTRFPVVTIPSVLVEGMQIAGE